jgi:PKD repeat protein
VSHVYNTPGVYAVTVSATDALGNMTSSAPLTITVVPRTAKVAKASIKAPAPLRLKALRTRSWRVRTTVTLDAGANVTVRLGFGKKTIARTTRNVPDGSTAISLLVPKGYRRTGTFTLTLRVAGSTSVSTATFRVR